MSNKEYLETGQFNFKEDEKYFEAADEFMEYHFKEDKDNPDKSMNFPVKLRDKVYAHLKNNEKWRKMMLQIRKHDKTTITVMDPFER